LRKRKSIGHGNNPMKKRIEQRARNDFRILNPSQPGGRRIKANGTDEMTGTSEKGLASSGRSENRLTGEEDRCRRQLHSRSKRGGQGEKINLGGEARERKNLLGAKTNGKAK